MVLQTTITKGDNMKFLKWLFGWIWSQVQQDMAKKK